MAGPVPRRGGQVLPAQAGVVRGRVSGLATVRSSPRAGGGGPAQKAAFRIRDAFSPRRRGWSGSLRAGRYGYLVLPAQAGVVRSSGRTCGISWSSPRAGGGGPSTAYTSTSMRAFSPRRRGWSAARDRDVVAGAVLPAQAGVVRRRFRRRLTGCGSPRAGGGGPRSRSLFGASRAFSPRRRGWSGDDGRGRGGSGVLPAQAGVVPRRGRRRGGGRGSPRAGGGGPQTGLPPEQVKQFSPRRRGWSGGVAEPYGAVLVLPAQAGVVRRDASSGCAGPRSPRAGGGGPLARMTEEDRKAFSPRRRGWSASSAPHLNVHHVLPAQAGVVRDASAHTRMPTSSPRAGGGGPVRMRHKISGTRFSPRRRGWSDRARGTVAALFVLPAQAGVVRRARTLSCAVSTYVHRVERHAR